MNRLEEFMEWYGLTCHDLMRRSAWYWNLLGLLMASAALWCLALMMGFYVLFGKKPK